MLLLWNNIFLHSYSDFFFFFYFIVLSLQINHLSQSAVMFSPEDCIDSSEPQKFYEVFLFKSFLL